DDAPPELPEDRPLQLAIVGRPNVGKSTLVNRLIGEDRMLTGPEPGITRDAIAIDWAWGARAIRLVDTAGLRRRSRVDDRLERQDLTIANLVAEEGRALVLALNKWDAIANREKTLKQVRERLETTLAQLQGVALVPVSGLKGSGLDKLLDAVLAADAVWNRRVPTAALNRWLAMIQEHHPPPVVGARRLRLRYMT